METLMVFVDYANIEAAAERLNIELNHGDLLGYYQADRFLIEAHAYVPIDPRAPHARDIAIEGLWSSGYYVHSKLGSPTEHSYKCNLDVELARDVVRTVYERRPDIVLIASGDNDFLPLVEFLRERGIRAEISAFADNAARELILKCAGFVDLQTYFTDYETAQVTAQAEGRSVDPYTDTAYDEDVAF